MRGIIQLVRANVKLRTRRGYLGELGWHRSVLTQKPVDAKGNPLPWMTYPAISFLENYVSPEHNVFEYGSGNSTLWFAERCQSVAACEHDKNWASFIQNESPKNASILHRGLSIKYESSIKDVDFSPDIVLIDGRRRIECAKFTIEYLGLNHVMILDNSEREKYAPIFDLYCNNGFEPIKFNGLGPINAYSWSTTIFLPKWRR